ncbi:crotonobetaine/carnitine-CoA ligase [Jatrophihabitans sp. GAS493]|uniref:AMP-binding protein n=1 Tax=Jatrophihabitans sp. GAS493 TaxID=1907575 RepID=UPI000BB86508|nr:AMP-binding protein [Jatrophihabitans sp. GAS493]SOD74632.1 crotonobetaine/carnitine-CoA ligase [Jatrophihabitans sp. GAS493]
MNSVDLHVPLTDRTIPALLDAGARRWPDRTALLDGHRRVSYAELAGEADRRGSALRELGIGWQQAVLLMLDNHVDHVLTWLGANYHGRVQAQVNTAYRGGLLTHVINNSDADTMVIEDQYCERLALIEADVPALRRVIVRGGTGAALPPGRFEVLDFDAVLTDGPGGGAEEPVQVWHRSAIVYTSGTTGPSKGVVQPHGLGFSYVSVEHWGLATLDDVVLVTLPQFHIAGQWTGVLAPLQVGGAAALVERFTATGFWDDVRRFSATQTTMIAAMVNFVLAQPERPDDAETTLCKVVMAPIVNENETFKKRFGVEIAGGLGQTEAVLALAARYGEDLPFCSGRVRPDFEARVVDANDLDVPRGEIGELIVRPREPWSTMLEYQHNPEATALKWRNLWLHSGDLVRQDEEDRFFYVDRNVDAIRRRGENISSVEVEAEIMRHPEVKLAAVVGVNSPDGEQEVMACLQLEPAAKLDLAALHAALRERLPYFMVPRYIEIFQTLPLTPTERVQKGELRKAGIGPDCWDARAHGLEGRHSDR